MERRITTKEAARMLHCSEATVRRKARQLGGKKLPGGRPWLFDREAVKASLR